MGTKVKVSATITLETEIWPQDYDGVEDVKAAILANDQDKAVEAVIDYERKLMAEDAGVSSMAEALFTEGDLADITITKTEAGAQTEEAA